MTDKQPRNMGELPEMTIYAIDDQKEEFIINDINFGISPSDVQVMDDNWVIEDSYLRSKAVFCYRSKHAETKVVLSIPFQVTNLNTSTLDSLNNTYNCIKLISQLNAYPFTFIKNQRIRTYIAPTAISYTNYMMFAVEEISLVQDSQASNMMFLEVVLLYFNHVPLVQDFNFVDKLRWSLYKDGEVERVGEQDIQEVSDLRDSEVWKQYTTPRLKKVIEKLEKNGLLALLNSQESTHYAMGVKVHVPLMSVIYSDTMSPDDGKIVSEDVKVIQVSDVSHFDNGTYEEMLVNLLNQDFSGDVRSKKQDEYVDQKVSEVSTTSKQDRASEGGNKDNVSPNPFNENSKEEAYLEEATERFNNEAERLASENSLSGSKQVMVDYNGIDISELDMAINTIKVTKKNKLASHQISSFKHPVIQYMGSYPVNVQLNMTSVNFDVYKNTEDYPTDMFFKQILNVLDYNRQAIPEAEAFNFLKIKSLATYLLDCEQYVPSQSFVSASASQQGQEHLAYSFHQSNLSSILEQTTVKPSGKLSNSKKEIEMIQIVLKWLSYFIKNDIIDILRTQNSSEYYLHSLDTFKSIILLGEAALIESGHTDGDYSLVFQTSKLLFKDLIPGAGDKIFKVSPLPTDTLPEFLYSPGLFISSSLISEEMKKNSPALQRALVKSMSAGSSLGLTRLPTDPMTDEEKEALDLYNQVRSSENQMSTSILSIFISLSAWVAKLLALKKKMIRGEAEGEFISYKETGRFNNLLLNTIALISAGREQGVESFTEVLGEDIGEDFFTDLTLTHVRDFYGYNYQDLDLESLVDDYDETTDIIVKSIDPFFFIKEVPNLKPETLENSYVDILSEMKVAEGITEIAQTDTNQYIQTEEGSTLHQGLQYIKLTEVQYDADRDRISSYTQDFEDLEGLGFGGINRLDLITSSRLAARIKDKDIALRYDRAVNFFLSKGWTLPQTIGIVTNLLAESNVDHKSVNKSSGAYGLAQWMTPRRNQFQKVYGKSIYESTFEEQLNFIQHELTEPGGYYTRLVGKPLKQMTGVIEATKIVLEIYEAPGNHEQELRVRGKAALDIFQSYEKGKIKPSAESSKPRESVLPKGASLESSNQGTYLEQFKENKGKSKEPLSLEEHQRIVKEISDSVVLEDLGKSSLDKATPLTVGESSKLVVTEVVDGDTIKGKKLPTGESITVRIAGMDTPESYAKGSNFEEYNEIIGKRASEELKKIIKKGSTVTIQTMGESYGRQTAKVTLADGTDPSLIMLRKGLAYVPDNLTSDNKYKKAETEARENKRGLWSLPDDIRVLPRTNQKKIAKGEDPILLTEEDLERTKNQNKAVLKFTDIQAKEADSPNAPKRNSFVPIKDYNAPISSPYGPRGGRKHKGVDFAAPVGTQVIAAADGIATTQTQTKGNRMVGWGKYVLIDHGNGFYTRYAHLSKHLVTPGQAVKFGDVIGEVGNTGDSSGPHLHYEVMWKTPYNQINPFATKPLTEYQEGTSVQFSGSNQINTSYSRPRYADFEERMNVTSENTVFNEDRLSEAIFKNILKNVNTGLKTSLPAIRVFITIGNENDKFWLDSMKLGIQYYEVKGVKSFKMNCNSDGNPIDTAILEIADPSFLVSDSFMSLRRMQGVSPNSIGTDYETQFRNDMILLKPGLKLHIRLGYGNAAEDLPIVFNGTIVDADTSRPQSIVVVCESYGKELLSDILAPTEPKFLNEQSDHISSSSVIAETLAVGNITHFGYKTGFWSSHFVKGRTDPEDRALSPTGLFSQSYNWGFDFTDAKYPQKLYMNIFAPEIERAGEAIFEDKGFLGYLYRDFWKAMSGLYTQGYPFAVYRMTPWAAMKQMEYRHPNTILKPMMFEDRQTMFFGIKEQTYFARDISPSLQNNAVQGLEEKRFNSFSTKEYYERRRERMEPVSNIHFITSSNNLISNGLSLNSNYSTRVKVAYYNKQKEEIVAQPWKQESLTMTIDDNLLPWEVRTKELSLSGCLSKYSAMVYGTTALKKETEKMYGGKILILGNPSLKSGDYVFLDDTEKRMSGLLLVREVFHHFDANKGFITEVVPGQYVEAANFLYSDLWFKLMCCSKIATSQMRMNAVSNFSTEDFNMTLDYLTIMNQLQLATESFTKYRDMWGPEVVASRLTDDLQMTAYYAAPATFGLLALRTIAKAAGIKGWTKGPNALRFGANTFKFSLAFVASYSTQMYRGIGFRFMQSLSNSSKHHYNKGLVGYAKWVKDITLNRPDSTRAKVIIGGRHYWDKVAGAATKIKPTGFTWWAGKTIVSSSLKMAYMTGRMLARSLFAGLTALTVASGVGIVLDMIVMFAASWVFDKIEEESFTRQPLLFFPIVRHGKAYHAGMAGVSRGEWWEDKKKELSKTIKEVRKAATIIQGSGEVRGGLSSWFATKTLEYLSDPDDYRNRPAVLLTDEEGRNVTKLPDGRVQEDPGYRGPENEAKEKEKQKELEEAALKNKLTEAVVETTGANADLPLKRGE